VGTVVVVLGTGNHFLADALAGALFVWAAWVLTGWFPASARPEVVPGQRDELAPALPGPGEP
jgi:hypothetical protein